MRMKQRNPMQLYPHLVCELRTKAKKYYKIATLHWTSQQMQRYDIIIIDIPTIKVFQNKIIEA